MRGIALLLLPLSLAAQDIAPLNKPGDLPSIEGQVIDAATGTPVRKATVVLTPETPPGPGFVGYHTSTGDSSKFAMKDLDPGRYRLTVSHTGYVNGEYGSRGP